jgi:hypothetical protein
VELCWRGIAGRWATPVSTKEGVTEFVVADGCTIKFVSLETSLHLASYKAAFMRQVFERFLQREDTLCYFDPDITLKCRWSFFEDWVKTGSLWSRTPLSSICRVIIRCAINGWRWPQRQD